MRMELKAREQFIIGEYERISGDVQDYSYRVCSEYRDDLGIEFYGNS